MDLTRKCLLRDAYDTFPANSIKKLEWFVSLSPPLDVHYLSIANFIDVDETGFYLERLAGKSGRTHTLYHLRHQSYYRDGDPNGNLIMRVEAGELRLPTEVDGSIQIPRRWIYLLQVNYDQYIFGDFCDKI